jgi:hypothetical protein
MRTGWTFYIEQADFGRRLDIYVIDHALQKCLVMVGAADGVPSVVEREAREGTRPYPFLSMSYAYADPFLDAMRSFLGNTVEHGVSKEIYEREAQRVDKMLDLFSRPPVVIDGKLHRP